MVRKSELRITHGTEVAHTVREGYVRKERGEPLTVDLRELPLATEPDGLSNHTKTFQLVTEFNQVYDCSKPEDFIHQIKRYECLNFISQNLYVQNNRYLLTKSRRHTSNERCLRSFTRLVYGRLWIRGLSKMLLPNGSSASELAQAEGGHFKHLL